VRLAPEALRELAAWVVARIPDSHRSGQEVGHFDKQAENRLPDGSTSGGDAGGVARGDNERYPRLIAAACSGETVSGSAADTGPAGATVDAAPDAVDDAGAREAAIDAPVDAPSGLQIRSEAISIRPTADN
jgi:hypothetical protein